MTTRLLTLASLLGLLLTACGGGEAEEPGGLDLPTDPDQVILDVRHVGGFAPVESLIGRVPQAVVTADRTLYAPGPQIAIYPGPLLPNVQEMRLDEETFQTVLDYVESIGFPGFDRIENRDAASVVADASNTVVTYYDEQGAHVFDVYALGFSEQQSDARVAMLADLVALLEDAGTRAESVGEYVPDRLEVNVGERDVPVEPEFRDVRPWPLPQPYGELSEGPLGWRCAAYEGEEAEELLEVFRDATTATTWELEGVEYSMIPRPLFPHEEGCPDESPLAG